MHESLDEFKFRPDTDTNTRVICPYASEKLLYNVVTSLAPSFLIGSSSYLQVMRTSITSRTLKFGTKLGNEQLYCVLKNQPHIAYQSLYLSIFLSL